MLPTNPLLRATAPAGPHLPAALLRQYAAGSLAPAARHRVEAHTLACPRCADALEGLLQTPPATTDQALAQLQQRLRLRTQPAAPAPRPRLAPRQHRWLPLQLAVAAALLLSLVAGGWWAWQQRRASVAPVAATQPTPNGGYAAWQAQLQQRSARFEPALPALAGAVRLRLVLSAAGAIQEITVVRSLRADYDAEAQRLVRTGPGWQPGPAGAASAARVVEVEVPF